MSAYTHHPMFPLEAIETPYRLLTTDGVSRANFEGEPIVKVAPQALTMLAAEAFKDCAHLLRPGHLQQLRDILDDGEASENDRFVALDLLKNANIAAAMVLPMCQDTGTAVIMGKKGQGIWTGNDDEAALAEGVLRTYTESNLRYSQVAPLDMFKEANTGNNLPAQIDIYACQGNEYKFLFIAKGGGSANKTFPVPADQGAVEPGLPRRFSRPENPHPRHRRLSALSSGGGDRRHLGRSKFKNRQAGLGPLSGRPADQGHRNTARLSATWNGRKKTLEITRRMGIGAQFGGKYFCHDVRVIRLARHGASCPVGIGVSCSADRQILGKITGDGVFWSSWRPTRPSISPT